MSNARIALVTGANQGIGFQVAKELVAHGWTVLVGARDSEKGQAAASDAARAAAGTCGAAYLHPLAKDTQVKHILGSAAHMARAFGLTGDDPADHLARARRLAGPVVLDVLRRYPPAPPGGGAAGELIRRLDAALR